MGQPRCPQGVRNIRKDPIDIRKVNDHTGGDLEMKLKDPSASVCPCCPQGGGNIRVATTDIREVDDHTGTDLVPTTQIGPDQHRARPIPKGYPRNFTFGLTYYPRGLPALKTDHAYYPRAQKVYPRCSGSSVLISAIETKCSVAL